MHLTELDKELFYKLWFGLIQFTNAKYNINSAIGSPDSQGGVDANKVVPIKDKLWREVSLIDEYLNTNSAIAEDERNILLGWKRHVTGDFILLKHLARYSVFMDARGSDPNLYGVVGLASELSELFPQTVMPIMVNATLLPFKGRIIYDSLLMAQNIRFGGGYKSSFNDAYKKAKEKHGIKTNLDALPSPIVTPVPKTRKKTSGKKRRERIYNEILVDTYGNEEDEMMSWYYYLEDKLSFPFNAVCIKEMAQSPILLNEKLTITGLSDINICGHGMFVNIKYKRRTLAIPMEQIEAVGLPKVLSEAIEDWKYWINGCNDG